MRSLLLQTALVSIVCLTPSLAVAESHEGVVRQIQVDSDIDTPLCVATAPAAPGGSLLCISPTRKHYVEMRELFLRALDSKHTCTFEWTQKDLFTNRPQISRVTCSAR